MNHPAHMAECGAEEEGGGGEVEEARTVRHGLIYDKDNRIVGIA